MVALMLMLFSSLKDFNDQIHLLITRRKEAVDLVGSSVTALGFSPFELLHPDRIPEINLEIHLFTGP
ncbi:unnamed protein product [Pleuronectes platessa]|uniref:Uncharacterized protein n=1 Tax=Pleuronectes platessa TaxID=8262 RepID=A0A9N7VR35_PLEPL|nr:unnamed protein product [Pleuronectes platessa]